MTASICATIKASARVVTHLECTVPEGHSFSGLSPTVTAEICTIDPVGSIAEQLGLITMDPEVFLMFPRLTAVIFDAIFDRSLCTSDRYKAANDALDEEIDGPLRQIKVEVNDAMLEAGVRAACEVETYGEPSLYEHDRIYRAYVAMERVRRIQSVAVPLEEHGAVEE